MLDKYDTMVSESKDTRFLPNDAENAEAFTGKTACEELLHIFCEDIEAIHRLPQKEPEWCIFQSYIDKGSQACYYIINP